MCGMNRNGENALHFETFLFQKVIDTAHFFQDMVRLTLTNGNG